MQYSHTCIRFDTLGTKRRFTDTGNVCVAFAFQLFKQGGTLDDISTGTQPDSDADSASQGGASRALGESITKVDLAVQARKEDTQLNVILQDGQNNPPPPTKLPPKHPGGDIQAAATPTNDTAKREYYSLLGEKIGPWYLDKTDQGATKQDRKILGAPTFAGTGATLT